MGFSVYRRSYVLWSTVNKIIIRVHCCAVHTAVAASRVYMLTMQGDFIRQTRRTLLRRERKRKEQTKTIERQKKKMGFTSVVLQGDHS